MTLNGQYTYPAGCRLFTEPGVPRALGAVSNPVKQCNSFTGGQGMVLWEQNSNGQIEYLAPNHHTLSAYLGGGNGTWSCENRVWGFADAICLLPKGMDTRWKHGGNVKNLHLVFTDDDLAELSWAESAAPAPI